MKFLAIFVVLCVVVTYSEVKIQCSSGLYKEWFYIWFDFSGHVKRRKNERTEEYGRRMCKARKIISWWNGRSARTKNAHQQRWKMYLRVHRWNFESCKLVHGKKSEQFRKINIRNLLFFVVDKRQQSRCWRCCKCG